MALVKTGITHNKCSAVAEMGDRLATIDMGRTEGKGAIVSHWVSGTGSPSNTMWSVPRPTSVSNGILIHPAVSPRQTRAADYTDAGKACARKFRKWWAVVPLSVRGAGSPSSITWPGPRPTCTSSFILIHPTAWPQYTNVTDRQTDRQDNNPTA